MEISEGDKWYARLGYIGRESMKSMIKKEFVVGISNIEIEKEICFFCLFGK